MGGTQKMIDATKQYSSFSDELNEVHFYITFPEKSNESILDAGFLHDKFGKEVGELLIKSGIKSYRIYGVGGGGGGEETLLDILKTLWENRDLVMFFSSILYFIKDLYKNYEYKSVENLYPGISFHFRIDSESNIDKLEQKDINWVSAQKLANLLVVSNGVLKKMKEKYPAFRFNSSVEIRIQSVDFASKYNIPQIQRETKEKKILGLINKIKVSPKRQVTYELTKLGVVKREDRTRRKDDKVVFKTFYFIVSKNILSDYFEKVNNS